MSGWVGDHPGRITHSRRTLAHKVHPFRLNLEGRDGVAHNVCSVNEHARTHGGKRNSEWSCGRNTYVVSLYYGEPTVFSNFGRYQGTLRTVDRVNEIA